MVDGIALLKTSMATIRLMICCCFGDYTLAKQKCQSIFPLEMLLAGLLDTESAWNLRAMLLHLFSTLYVHSATFTKGLVRMPMMRQLMQLMSDLINQYLSMDTRRPDFVVDLSARVSRRKCPFETQNHV